MSIQVVMPSLDQGRYIGEALGSLLEAAGEVDLEVAVIDGGSSDDTLARVAALLEAPTPARVRVLSEPDGGQSEAINKGIALGSAPIVGWLNADDRLLPGTLSRVAAAFAEHPGAVLVYGDVRYVDEAGDPLHDLREQDFRYRNLLWGPCYIPQPSTFVRRSAWERAGGLREDLRYAMDLDLWLRLSRHGAFVHLPEILSEFRLHPASKTVSAAAAARREARAVRVAHASRRLGRTPSGVEVSARYFATRCRRRLRRAAGAIPGASR